MAIAYSMARSLTRTYCLTHPTNMPATYHPAQNGKLSSAVSNKTATSGVIVSAKNRFLRNSPLLCDQIGQYIFGMKQTLLALGFCLAPFAAAAHPHVFIDAGVSFIFDKNGKLSAVKVEWSYDDMYTLLQLDEMGLDSDGDGVITVSEQQRLAGFDTNWIDGFEGDVYLTQNGKPLKLGRPQDPGATLEDDSLFPE